MIAVIESAQRLRDPRFVIATTYNLVVKYKKLLIFCKIVN